MKNGILIFLVWLVSISSAIAEVAEITIPVPEECVDSIQSSLELSREAGILTYEYHSFNYEFAKQMYPRLSGYMIIRSKKRSVERLKMFVNGPLFLCYPVSTHKFSGTDTVNHILELTKRMQSHNHYLELTQDGITLYSKNPVTNNR